MEAMDSDRDGMGNSILPFNEDVKITDLPITEKIKNESSPINFGTGPPNLVLSPPI
jgi:hypothetical protein